MLNNLTNFFNLIKQGKIKKALDGSDLLAVGTKDSNYNGNYQPTLIQFEDLEKQLTGAIPEKGLEISFDKQKIYNTYLAPGNANITNDLTGATLGITQKIYHNSVIAPSMPAGWVLVGGGIYVPGVLNIINAEWCGDSRVEYWVTQ